MSAEKKVTDLMEALETSLREARDAREQRRIGSEPWLRERFPDKDWHRHRRTDGGTDLCDGTPSDCRSKARIDVQPYGEQDGAK